jgi:DNA modification methylase
MAIRFLHGDCRVVLPTLPADSFDCCVTSPPYWGLRDYGTATWEGGDEDCDHKPPAEWIHKNFVATATTAGASPHAGVIRWYAPNGDCRCGARRIDAQIGLEPTMQGYLDVMVDVCREVRRVLKPDGTFWLNIGDSYCSTDKWGGGGNTGKQTVADDGLVPSWQVRQRKQPQVGLKPKDLCMIPNRLAIALQDDGWWVRSEIIWHKPNPMPESVTDRPTSAHEKVWLLTKSDRYFYDAAAIAEPAAYPEDKRRPVGSQGAWQMDGREQRANGGGRAYDHDTSTRNARNVWTIPSQPYRGAHFATMPPDLVERCIKAGCPAGGQVLDPFGGAGTTGLVADRLQRNATLIDLNGNYQEMGLNRIRDDAPLFVEIV